MLEIGLKNKQKNIALPNYSAKSMQSGELNVLATPAVVALMENTAWKSVQNHINKDETTVGTYIEIKHISPTPVNASIEIISELTEINNRELVFKIEGFDSKGKIAEAIHKRFIVNSNKFQTKADLKLSN